MSKTTLMGILKIIKDAGLDLKALDVLPDGTYRWHFSPPADAEEEALNRSLAEYDRKHGYRK